MTMVAYTVGDIAKRVIVRLLTRDQNADNIEWEQSGDITFYRVKGLPSRLNWLYATDSRSGIWYCWHDLHQIYINSRRDWIGASPPFNGEMSRDDEVRLASSCVPVFIYDGNPAHVEEYKKKFKNLVVVGGDDVPEEEIPIYVPNDMTVAQKADFVIRKINRTSVLVLGEYDPLMDIERAWYLYGTIDGRRGLMAAPTYDKNVLQESIAMEVADGYRKNTRDARDTFDSTICLVNRANYVNQVKRPPEGNETLASWARKFVPLIAGVYVLTDDVVLEYKHEAPEIKRKFLPEEDVVEITDADLNNRLIYSRLPPKERKQVDQKVWQYTYGSTTSGSAVSEPYTIATNTTKYRFAIDLDEDGNLIARARPDQPP